MRLIDSGSLAACAVLLGCGAPHRQGPEVRGIAALPQVTLCRTTEAELRAALGVPTRDGLLHDARVMSWITGASSEGAVRYLAVLLDAHGVVIDRVWNLPTEIPWLPADQCTRPTAP
ncbi:MAG TPA: hypothetical protein VGD37_04425 [Kofleriaceae bacterium]|jgi:hypothetical protein